MDRVREKVEEQFRSRRQVAERWGCSVATIKRREKSGLLTAIKIGTPVKFRLSEIESIEQAATVR